MSEPGSQNQPDEALVDLLIKQVTEGLSPAEQRALDVLDSATARDHLRQFERAAAARRCGVGLADLPGYGTSFVRSIHHAGAGRRRWTHAHAAQTGLQRG